MQCLKSTCLRIGSIWTKRLYWLVMGQWIYFHRKFMLKNNLPHFMESHFKSVSYHEFRLMPESRNFINFMWNYSEIGMFSTQNHDELGKLALTEFMFYANCKKWNHIHAQFTSDTIISRLKMLIWQNIAKFQNTRISVMNTFRLLAIEL